MDNLDEEDLDKQGSTVLQLHSPLVDKDKFDFTQMNTLMPSRTIKAPVQQQTTI